MNRILAAFVILVLAWFIINRMKFDASVEKAKQKQLEIYKHIVFSASSLQVYLDRDLVCVEVNDSYLQAFGKSREEVIGHNLAEMHDKGVFENEFKPALDQCLAGHSISEERWIDFPAIGNRFISTQTDPHLDKDGSVLGLIVISTDITIRKEAQTQQSRLEDELFQAQKLESLGHLSAGLAHEINTPSQYVSDNLSFMADAVSKLEPFLQELQKMLAHAHNSGKSLGADDTECLHKLYETADIEFMLEETSLALVQSQNGMDRIKKTVLAMKAFSHPGDERVEVDLNEEISNTLIIAGGELKDVAELVVDLDKDLPKVRCIPSAINRALLNIVVNAAHAIADVADDGKPGEIRVSTTVDGDQAIIRIIDNGPGMSEEVLEKIFNPFFTTKEVGKGTGQGLPIARKVINEDHKGSIFVDSVLGEGSCFTISLPLN